MSKDTSFVLDIGGGKKILTDMMMPTIKQKAAAITARANSMAATMSDDPPEFTMTTQVGTIKNGVRAFATISSGDGTRRQNYIANYVIARAKDAGR